MRILIIDKSDEYVRDLLNVHVRRQADVQQSVGTPLALTRALTSQEWDIAVIGQPIPNFPPDEAMRIIRVLKPELLVISLPGRSGEKSLERIMESLCPERTRSGRSLLILSEILDAIPQGVFWKDTESVYIGCNRVFAKHANLRYPREIAGKTDYDLPWPTEEAEAYRADDREVIQTRQPKRHIVEQMQQADGTRLWIDTTKVPLVDENGNIYGVLGIFDNITELRRSEEALWHTTQMLKLVLDHIPARVFWKDTNSVYLGCNYLFAANAGLTSPEEIVGKTDFDLPWTREESESYRADDQQVMRSGIPKLNYEETQYIAEGRTTWVNTSKIPLRDTDGKIIGVLGTFEDITERKHVEEALKREVAFTNAMLDTASAVIVVLDKDGVIVRFNRYCQEISGYSLEEALGRHVWDFLLLPEEAEATKEAFSKSLKGLALDYFENYWKTKDGHLRRLAWSSNVILNDRGEPEHVIGIALDVSERKRGEEEKRQFYRETIRSVTDGKLEVSNAGEVQPYETNSTFIETFGNIRELSEARHRLQAHCLSMGLHADSMDLFATAIGEAMNNALKHAGEGRVFCGSKGGELWVGVSDSGSGISALTLPKATLRRGYSSKVSLGMGYSIMLDAADRVMLSTGSEGTTVIMFRSLLGKKDTISLADLPDIWDTIPSA